MVIISGLYTTYFNTLQKLMPLFIITIQNIYFCQIAIKFPPHLFSFSCLNAAQGFDLL